MKPTESTSKQMRGFMTTIACLKKQLSECENNADNHEQFSDELECMFNYYNKP